MTRGYSKPPNSIFCPRPCISTTWNSHE